jgi:CBS domain containing-hemolysin-like protein
VDREEESLVRRVFRLTDRVVGDIMVHRTAVVGIPAAAPVKAAVALIRERGFSRIPVFGGTPEEIVGAVRAKDLLLELDAGRAEVPVAEVMRPVLYVPETKPVVELLEEMRHGRSQLAVVLEEYGSIAGIVTIEDLIEEIVGEIPGESRPQPKLVYLAQPDRIVVDATIDLPTLNDVFGVALDTEDATTLGGFIFRHLGRIPDAGERFTAAGLTFTIESVVGRRIGRVEIRKSPAPQP